MRNSKLRSWPGLIPATLASDGRRRFKGRLIYRAQIV